MSNENVTLSDLSSGAVPTATPVGMPVKPKLDTSSATEANIKEVVIPSTPNVVEGTGNPMLDKAFLGIDDTISRLQVETNETYEKGEEQRIEEAINSDNTDIDTIDETLNSTTSNTVLVHKFDEEPTETTQTVKPSPAPVVEEKPVKIEKTVEVSAPVAGTKSENIVMVEDESVYDEDEHLFDGIEDDDLKYLDEDESSEDEDKKEEEDEKVKTEKVKAIIREEVNKNFVPVDKKINLGSFKISKKPINAAKVINDIKTKAIECADGVLFSQKRAVRMSAWKPMEIQSIDPSRLRSGNYNKYIENKLKLIYDHIVDANKPKSFEAWAMITPNTVIDDYMFTAYKATFGLSNIITFSCSDTECNNVFMEPVPIHSMLKFRDDSIKDEYMKILHEGNTDSVNSEYEVSLYQASDDYVFALKVPSLYNTYIEPTLVNQDFNAKYEDRLLLLSYIDAIYKIDYANNELIPIDTKPVATDKSLTYKRRIKTFDTILKSLTSDQLMALSVETDKYDGGKLDDDGELIRDVTYVYPERRCPKCGKKIDEQEINPDNMLFTRHQLGLMKKI
jgi:hypothetical protein|nr:MAG TPA: hypothetical protein [Caudoviricetes sp.]